jgi:hypothetical protein
MEDRVKGKWMRIQSYVYIQVILLLFFRVVSFYIYL